MPRAATTTQKVKTAPRDEDTSVETAEYLVRQIVADEMGLDPSGLRQDMKLVGDVGAESLDCVEILMNVEERFQRDFDDEFLIESLKGDLTIRDLVAYAEGKLALEFAND